MADYDYDKSTGEFKKVRSKTGQKRNSSWSAKRHLSQYNNLTDDEFEDVMLQNDMGIKKNEAFEKRIQHKLGELSADYDFSDLKINDRYQLRALCQAIINLEDYELYAYNIRTAGNIAENIMELKEINAAMSKLRDDISKIQNDLQITRKARKSDSETSVIAFLETLKTKAKKFYDAKMKIIICPTCNKWVASFWFLFPDAKRNKLQIQCMAEREDGSKCGTIITLTDKELVEIVSSTNDDLLPLSIR